MVDLQASKVFDGSFSPFINGRPSRFCFFAGGSVSVQHVLRHDFVPVRGEGPHCHNAGRQVLRHQSASRVHVQGRD